MAKAYLNNLAEEGSRQELIEWLVKLDAENDRLRSIGRRLLYHDERGQGVEWQETMEELYEEINS